MPVPSAIGPRFLLPAALCRLGKPGLLAVGWLLAVAVGPVPGQAPAPAPAPAAAAAVAAPAAAGQRIKLSTSDQVTLAAWYYPAVVQADAATDKPAARRTPVVILLHDLGGSHKTLEPLAGALQARGIAVVAPDLRGHGATTPAAGRGPANAAAIKKPDFEAMVMTAGGQVRDQAAVIGDVEAVRNWIAGGPEAEKFDMTKLVIVGSGAGAAVAAHWTLLDARWPDLATGPQGRQVRGLVLVSPAWATRGFAIAPALGDEPVQRSLPVLVIAGSQDTDAVKIYDQLKRQRPDGWNEKRSGQDQPTQAAKLGADGLPSLYLRQFDSRLTGDGLAAYVPKDPRGSYPATVIDGFLNAVTTAEP
ncbi:MAG: alpha/beta hydrolase [Planctomycetaceae bacterium]